MDAVRGERQQVRLDARPAARNPRRRSSRRSDGRLRFVMAARERIRPLFHGSRSRKHGRHAILSCGPRPCSLSWSSARPLAAADTLTPFDVARIRRRSRAVAHLAGRLADRLHARPCRAGFRRRGRRRLGRAPRRGTRRGLPRLRHGRGERGRHRLGEGRKGDLLPREAGQGREPMPLRHRGGRRGGRKGPLPRRARSPPTAWRPTGSASRSWRPTRSRRRQKDLEKKGLNQQVYEESAKPVRIWMASLAEGGREAESALEIAGSASELKWSPVGTFVAFGLAPTSLVDDGYMRSGSRSPTPDSGKVVARIENPGKLGADRRGARTGRPSPTSRAPTRTIPPRAG